MPELSRFYGIIIKMYFQLREHNPTHIHAIYNGDMAEIDIRTGEIIEGYLPRKACDMVKEWCALHRDELIKIWDTQEFISIDPLD